VGIGGRHSKNAKTETIVSRLDEVLDGFSLGTGEGGRGAQVTAKPIERV